MKRLDRTVKDSSVPLYQQVAAKLAREITSGRIRANAPLPSINRLESELGVARNTVIQAMRQLVSDGYAVARHGKGYFAVDHEEKPVLNVVLPLHHYYYIQIYVNLIAGAQEMADQNGERLQIYNSYETHAGFISALREITSYRPDARIIAVPPADKDGYVIENSARELEKISKAGARLVVVDRKLHGCGIPQIVQDKLGGRKLLLERLIRKCCASAIFFGASEHEEALRDFVLEHGWRGKLSFSASAGIAEDLAAVRNGGYDTAFLINDLHARRLASSAGGRPGFDFAGYDGTMSATSLSPMISTVNSNLMHAGEKAYSLLSGNSDVAGVHMISPFFVKGDTF